jgi:2-polyprenyl-6-methoxyphenol hydroxylase-like FAD-dependent oxidoreductase
MHPGSPDGSDNERATKEMDMAAAQSPARTPEVVVVGGGIAGLGSAVGLARAGIQVQVLERASAFGEVGAGLQMAPNATRILRRWGLLDEVIDHGVLPRRLMMKDAVDGADLTHLDLAEVGRRYGAPYVVIHRTDLHRILLDACARLGVDLVTGAEVSEVDLDGDGATVRCSATRSSAAAVVLGADGLESRLRRRISSDVPVSSNYVAYRGTRLLDEMEHPDRLELADVVVHIGPGCHLVQYPLRGGTMFNQVAVFQSPAALAGEPTWGTPDELEAAFAGTSPTVRAALDDLWRDRWWPMYDREPIDTWVDGRLALIGDAAHPMLQYLAQGACQALEDAAALETLVAGRSPSAADVDWDHVLKDYTAARAGRTAQVQKTARAWGEFWHCRGKERAARNALLRFRATDDFSRIDWLYGA